MDRKNKEADTQKELLRAMKFLIYFVVCYARCNGGNASRTIMALRIAFKNSDNYQKKELLDAIQLSNDFV